MGSIPGRVIPKTMTMVPVASLLGSQYLGLEVVVRSLDGFQVKH